MKSKNGFTLIELIIVIVILGIIAVVAVPKYQDITVEAKSNTLKATLGNIRAAISIDYAKNAAGGSASFPTALVGTLFQSGTIPTDPYKSSNAVVALSGTDVIDTDDLTGDTEVGGWLYKAATGEVRMNHTTYISY